MKKIIYILSLCFLLLISSCSKNSSNITTISFSTWGSQSEISTVKNLIKSFEHENPNIKINLIHIPEKYFQKLHLLVASELMPDVVFVNNLNSRIYIRANKFESLNSYLERSDKLKTETFFAKSLEPMTYNGNVYAIPRDISNLVIYYNKDIFNKYKITYPNSSWTMDDFLTTAKNLTKDTDKDGKIDIFGFGFEKNSLYWLPFLLSNGGGIISQDEKGIVLGSENSLDALKFYTDLRNKYHVAPKSDEQASLTTSQLFLQGKVAMHLCGRWCSLTYKKNADFNWGIVQFPNGKNGSIVGLDASGWAISSSCKHKNEAWKFIEFMASEKSAKQMTADGLIFPANKFAADIIQNKNDIEIYKSALLKSIKTPLSSKYQEINDILTEELEPVFDGKKDVKSAISNELTKKLEDKLD